MGKALKASGKGNRHSEVLDAVKVLQALKAKAAKADAAASASDSVQLQGHLRVIVVDVAGSALQPLDVEAKCTIQELRLRLEADSLENGDLVQAILLFDGRALKDGEQLGGLCAARPLELQLVSQVPDREHMNTLLHSRDLHVRHMAAVALGKACLSTQALGTAFLVDPHVDVRVAAARAYLHSALNNKRRIAAQVIVKDGQRCDVEQMLQDPAREVRRLAISAIGSLGYKIASTYSEELQALMLDEDDLIRQKASAALKVVNQRGETK